MWQIVAIGVGGSCGALARFGINGLAQRCAPGFAPLGTLAANVLGCLLIGVLMVWIRERSDVPKYLQDVLVTGFLGSLTTFSTFGYQSLELFLEQRPQLAVVNVVANLALGLAAVWMGMTAARALM